MKNAGLLLLIAAVIVGCGGRQDGATAAAGENGTAPEEPVVIEPVDGGMAMDVPEEDVVEEEETEEEEEIEVNEYGEPVSYDTVRLGRETLVLMDVENECAGMHPTTIYRHAGGEVTELKLGFAVKHQRGNVFCLLLEDFNAVFDPGDGSEDDGIFMGHCYYAYPCRYENGRFHEYKTTQVSVAAFMKRRGARECVEELAAEGWILMEVLDREDGHTFLNLRRYGDGGSFEQAYADFGHDFMENGVYRRRVLNDDGLTLLLD